MNTLQHLGLDLLATRLEEHGLGSLAVEKTCIILGRADLAGSSRPLPSSAALLLLGDEARIWLPAPVEPADPSQGRAPLYLHGGKEWVFPTVRLFVRAPDQNNDQTPLEYLTLSEWLLDAAARWRYPPIQGGPALPLLDHLAGLERRGHWQARILEALARTTWYALFGADSHFVVSGLRLPPRPLWLRPAGDTAFAREVNRSLVVTARLGATPDAVPEEAAAVPTTNLRAAAYRIRPTDDRDWGIDPVHTPEGADIRLTGRLGVGVLVSGRRLLTADPQRPALSASTGRLPFAGYNDPRRLLMAANMQAHAVPLAEQEPPRVRLPGAAADPPGVNLRVAYLAWQGWNHEDAWVLSASAARRLATIEHFVQTISIRAIELPPEVLVRPGQVVARGDLLLRRFAAPVLLSAALDVLAKLNDLDDKVVLRPEEDDRAPEGGTVTVVEDWDLANLQGIPENWEVPTALTGAFRAVYRIHLERRLPLAVGDKLANRHGHKGIVGAIIPDEEMPRWRGEPLEALIDPISVWNRSNWGQVYESLAGVLSSGASGAMSGAEVVRAVRELPDGPDARGRWPIAAPTKPGWVDHAMRGVAGIQYVMRMPHHACDKISGSAPTRALAAHVRPRDQRLGEMEQWALWAHDRSAATVDAVPTSAVARLRRLLRVAGYDIETTPQALVVQKLTLGEALPPEVAAFSLHKQGGDLETLASAADLFDALDALDVARQAALVFDPPLAATSSRGPVRWLPVLPAADRPPQRLFDGSAEPHELTRLQRRVVRLLRERHKSALDADDRTQVEADLSLAVAQFMRAAYGLAVGHSATGQFSSKRSFLRRGVLGRRLNHSARATISPGGALHLDLDEVGLPPALAHIVFGPGLPADPQALAAQVAGRRLWLKRDPVLHRWGILPVRVRLTPGDTIRLPAALLGPLGADFDGDTVAAFGDLGAAQPDPEPCTPPVLAWHPLLEEALFKPGKQYQYGLYLLAQDPALLARLNQALASAGAPPWPAAEPRMAWAEWTHQAVASGPRGRWWAILEEHALAALAFDPGMDFGLGAVDDLARAPAVRCGAAKDLYGGLEPPPAEKAAQEWHAHRQTLAAILNGQSLSIYARQPQLRCPDPIADVMVAGKASIGQFGGALRRLLYSAERLRPEDIQQAQCLTEQVTQKALSVKAGKPPLVYSDFERQLRCLLNRQEPDAREFEALVAEIGVRLQPVWQHLRTLIPAAPNPWLEWLRRPHELKTLIEAHRKLVLPLADIRLRPWLHMAWQAASETKTC